MQSIVRSDGILEPVMSGFFSGILVIIMSVTYAVLIFSGDLSRYIPQGIALAITGVIVVSLFVVFLSDHKQTISQTDDDTAPIFALLATMVVSSMPESASDAEIVASVLAALMLATLISGIGLTLFGALKYGAFIQYLPYSVMGGYFTAVGWLLVVGGLKVTTGVDYSDWSQTNQMLEANTIYRLLPALVLGGWLLLVSNRVPLKFLLPGSILASVLLFFLGNWFAGHSPNDLLLLESLIGPFSSNSVHVINTPGFDEFKLTSWAAIFINTGTIGSILLISFISIMFYVSGLSVTLKRDLEINRELKIAGLGNMASALAGGMAALPSLSLSRLAHEMGAKNASWSGAVSVIVCVVIFYWGLEYIAYTPKFVLGGLLLYIGFGFLREWLLEGWRKFGLSEYAVIPVILLVSVLAGFLVGIVVGLVAAIILFVVKYSQINVVRFKLTGTQLSSNVERNAETKSFLRDHGDRILSLGLQGFLFFGTTGKLYGEIARTITDTKNRSLKYIVLDFSQVTGVDASAALNFEKIAHLCSRQEIDLVVTGIRSELLERLGSGGFDLKTTPNVMQMSDLERGVEWCENRILSGVVSVTDLNANSFFEQIQTYLGAASDVQSLKDYLTRMEVPAGYELTKQGHESNELYFLETTSASAYVQNADGQSHRVRRTAQGTVYGEIGFFLRVPRTATVITDEAGVVYSLSYNDLQNMEIQNPEIAAGLGRYMAHLLTERLLFTTDALKAVLV